MKTPDNGIATDVLLYLDNRFDSIKKEQQITNRRLFEKLDEISKVSNEQLLVAKTQNSRIYKLEEKHNACPGAAALREIEIMEAENLIKDKKENKIGTFVVNLAATSTVAAAILSFFAYLKNNLR